MQRNKNIASYIRLFESGVLTEREWEARLNLHCCHLCPQKCGADRVEGKVGHCKNGILPSIASYRVLYGDSRAIFGNRGSGAIEFLDYGSSEAVAEKFMHKSSGERVLCTESELAAIMMMFQDSLCHNINLISPTHFIPQIIGAVKEAVAMGLNIPIVYTTSGYERPETLHLLDRIADIYIVDFGMFYQRPNGLICKNLSDMPDFPDAVCNSLREMYRQAGDLVLDRQGIAKKGLLIKNPEIEETKSSANELFRDIASEISGYSTICPIRGNNIKTPFKSLKPEYVNNFKDSNFFTLHLPSENFNDDLAFSENLER
ncbi:MAG: radical SAM protein [Methanomicrobium sp.]|nr:radical SAM protein [Methanomicrobium sp.]